jgi:predicted DCC family thiol-disulfide oxidoreductase YuxK
MQTNLATKFSPVVSDDKKLEVSLVDNQAVIKLSTWTEDIGWCCQKTLSLDAEMLEDLHRVIASARYKLKSRNAEMSEITQPSNILKFPNFS